MYPLPTLRNRMLLVQLSHEQRGFKLHGIHLYTSWWLVESLDAKELGIWKVDYYELTSHCSRINCIFKALCAPHEPMLLSIPPITIILNLIFLIPLPLFMDSPCVSPLPDILPHCLTSLAYLPLLLTLLAATLILALELPFDFSNAFFSCV